MDTSWLFIFKRKIIIGMCLLLCFSMAFAMIFVVILMRQSLLQENAHEISHFGSAIYSSLRFQMLKRSPTEIQRTIQDIGSSEQIKKIFIIDKNGQVAFSSDEAEIGKKMNNQSEPSCRICHQKADSMPSEATTILKLPDGDVYRNVTVINNSPACFGCHPQSERIIGKLIIDRSLASTYSFIRTTQMLIFMSGTVCLALVIPFLSSMLNRYINEILLKNGEIRMVYSIINNISKTINVEELKSIVLDLVSDALSAEEIDMAVPKRDGGYRVISRNVLGEKFARKKLKEKDPVIAIINRWLNNDLSSQEISPDMTEVYIPIEKAGHRHALIIVRNRRQRFLQDRITLISAISNHIAIAFENARLYSIAITDELTGLFTVRHFRTCIDQQMFSFEHYGERFVLLMIDIDDFKKVNDTYGHVTGDSVLKQVGACIADAIRDNDQGFRYGGEEFTVLLPSTGEVGGRHVAERIRTHIENADIVVDGVHIRTTVSIGLAICPDNTSNIRDLTIAADMALYAAKKAGKNRTVVSQVRPAGSSEFTF